MTRWIEGTVSYLQCKANCHTTPHLTFSSDTDMVTAGLVSLSSLTGDVIVIAEMTEDELGGGASDAVQRRVNKFLGRDDLRVVQFRRAEESPTPAGISFQQFAQTYVPPRLIFACPHCSSDAVDGQHQTPTRYKRDGGVVIIVADLEIRDGS